MNHGAESKTPNSCGHTLNYFMAGLEYKVQSGRFKPAVVKKQLEFYLE